MLDFGVVITDESHFGSSTDKTKTDIIDGGLVGDFMKNKITIFASGTPNKTKTFYGINPSYVYEWETTDKSYMKKLSSDPSNEFAIEYMSKRHGPVFLNSYNDLTLDKNYQKCPSQVLMKHTITDESIKEINEHNTKYNTKYGYNCSSLLELMKTPDQNNKNGYKCEEKFALCETNDGNSILLGFFDKIISSSRTRKDTETIQSRRNMKLDGVANPSLIIIYLPTHTGNNTILKLQRTLKAYLKKMWIEYDIEYSNSFEESDPNSTTTSDRATTCKEYNEYLDIIMRKTRESTPPKKGYILLLGNKSGVGITYKDCDVTISLDDGHNLDNQKQRYARALTERDVSMLI